MSITKQEAGKVVKKFKMKERKGKELFYKFIWKGTTVLTTAIPKGKGPLNCANDFRKQLLLSEEELEAAKKCPFKRPDLIARLKKAGEIPEGDEDTED
ncbi:MAG TPA: hypothetical protein VN493_27000 [Thermoanaerobaculia bacterium]|nr:hypothetical protein [Thermoanaerobaculia bacterium]